MSLGTPGDEGLGCAHKQNLFASVRSGSDGLESLESLFEHSCIDCLRAQTVTKRHGEEWLYNEEEPFWIVAKREAEEARALAEKIAAKKPVHEAKAKPKPARGLPEGMTPEEYIVQMLLVERLPEGVVIQEAKKLLDLSKNEALLRVKGLARQAAIDAKAKKKQEMKKNTKKEEDKVPVSNEPEKEEEPAISAKKEDAEKVSTKKVEEEEEKKKEKPVEHKHEDDEKQHVRAKKTEMSWSPALHNVFCAQRYSLLDAGEQKRYCSIIANLSTDASTSGFKQKSNLAEIKAFDHKVSGERVEYEVEVRRMLTEMKKCIWDYHTAEAVKMVLDRLRSRYSLWKDDVKYSSNPLLTLQWKEKGESTVTPDASMQPMVTKILNKPTDPDQLKMPCITSRSGSALSEQLMKERFRDEKTTQVDIEEDEILRAHCKSEGCPVAIEASSLRALYTNGWVSRMGDYVLPVAVREEFGSSGRHKVAFISKPLSYGHIPNPSLWRKYTKLMVKGTLVKPRKPTHVGHRSRTRKRQADGNLVVDVPSSSETLEGVSPSVPTEPVKTSPRKQVKEDSTSSTYSPIDAIMKSIAPITSTGRDTDNDVTVSGAGSGTKMYTVLKLGASAMPILVRSSGGLLHPSGKTVTVEPKVEYVPQCGALKLDPEEWLWNYMKFLTTGSEDHILFRTHYSEHLILQTEHMKPHKDRFVGIKEEANFQLLCNRTDRVRHLLEEVGSLVEGTYLITVERDKLNIYKETDGETDSVNEISRASLQASLKGDGVLPKFNDYFPGVDAHRVLTWQVTMGRAPCTFLPEDHPSVAAWKKIYAKSGGQGKRPGGAGRRGTGRGGGRGGGRGRGRGGGHQGGERQDTRGGNGTGRGGGRGGGHQGGERHGGEAQEAGCGSGNARNRSQRRHAARGGKGADMKQVGHVYEE